MDYKVNCPLAAFRALHPCRRHYTALATLENVFIFGAGMTALNAALTACGCFAETSSNDRADPWGSRRSCSQFRWVETLTPMNDRIFQPCFMDAQAHQRPCDKRKICQHGAGRRRDPDSRTDVRIKLTLTPVTLRYTIRP